MFSHEEAQKAQARNSEIASGRPALPVASVHIVLHTFFSFHTHAAAIRDGRAPIYGESIQI